MGDTSLKESAVAAPLFSLMRERERVLRSQPKTLCARRLPAAGSSPGEQEAPRWCLRHPFAQQSGLPLPLSCPYLMSAHHNRYLLAQNQGWKRGAQQDAVYHGLGQDNGRHLPAGHADTFRPKSSWSAGAANRGSPAAPSPSNGRSSSAVEQAWMSKQHQVPTRVPNLEISLGRQGWQHKLQDQQQQQQSSVESTATKELTLLKCL
uniref:Uncharacterized protein n=1 Tax=Arundo donax TaxID=35708 RepID=A0A0A9CM79_ARUDO